MCSYGDALVEISWLTIALLGFVACSDDAYQRRLDEMSRVFYRMALDVDFD